MPFQIIRDDITRVKADVIVNLADPEPHIGNEIENSIYNAAGKERLLAERKKIGTVRPGQVFWTPAFDLEAKSILHLVTLPWSEDRHGGSEMFKIGYANALLLADEQNAESIAFPMILSELDGFPKDVVLQLILKETEAFLLTHEMDVILVVSDEGAFQFSSERISQIDAYIREKETECLDGVDDLSDLNLGQNWTIHELYSSLRASLSKRQVVPGDAEAERTETSFNKQIGSLESVLEQQEETFQQRLLSLIDKSGMDDVAVYKRANVDRKQFSKIRGRVNYQPSKETVLAFAIALRLNLRETKDLLLRAGYALSPSRKADLIVEYYVTNKIYNIFEINATLFRYGEQLLGGKE